MSKILKVRMRFTEELLGMSPSDPELYKAIVFQQAKEDGEPVDPVRLDEEIAALPLQEETRSHPTVFPRIDDKPLIWDYQIKGSFKDACGLLWRADGTFSSKVKAYKKIINGLIFVEPRAIMLQLPEGGTIGTCIRPLIGSTPQGERICISGSETVPVGTTMEYSVEYMPMKSKEVNLEDCIMEWISFNARRGFGQWRNSGKGRYSFEVIKVDPTEY